MPQDSLIVVFKPIKDSLNRDFEIDKQTKKEQFNFIFENIKQQAGELHG